MTERPGTVVLTGAASGIGAATAHRLAATAHVLVLLGPEPESITRRLLSQVRASGSAQVHYVAADFTRLSEVVDAARAVRSLVPTFDLLINDAGVPGSPERIVTADGSERDRKSVV